MSVLRWTTLLLLVKFSSQSACGDTHSTGDCSCQWHLDGTWVVDCTGRGLSELPEGIPVNTTYLDASKNNILEIPNDTLLRLQYLNIIVLDFNNLTSLPKFPKGIRIISANYNSIQSIDGAFDGLSALIRVGLDGNNVTFINNRTFKDTMDLRQL
ncbi:leucine-rich repeat-containing G-protein coupled receptor 4-like isoform X1 [Anneissia japonica]|uniref:leucine-rich repeat-containing G-protein coupled receptor 4-like isoform X1 n=1 Tax=Anneissia japonica TaxID=1529436 RepID=UPI001425AD3E|nr:leucine-rich repeat-containing G-protein coupled receptor 4-like isoform X1 [Anneissia japonica]